MKRLREIAEAANKARTPAVCIEYVMPRPGAFVGEHTRFVVADPPLVLALLDVAEAARVAADEPWVGGIDAQPAWQLTSSEIELRDALARLREVSP